MRKLNTAFLKDMGLATGAAGAAMLWDEIAGAAVIDATARDGKVSPMDMLLQMVIGWGPLAFAATRPPGNYFWPAFGGAIAFNRIDNLMIALGQPALTPLGPIRPGETLETARARIAVDGFGRLFPDR